MSYIVSLETRTIIVHMSEAENLEVYDNLRKRIMIDLHYKERFGDF